MTVENITICGRLFNIPVPDRYEPGNTIQITPGESSSIKQTFCENIRNNVAARMKKDNGAVDDEGALLEDRVEDWQSKVDEYALGYQFGVRAVGGGRVALDPETREAMSLIREAIRSELRKKYGAKHGRTADQVNEAAVRLLDSPKGERYRILAKQRLVQFAETATDVLGDIDIPEPDLAA